VFPSSGHVNVLSPSVDINTIINSPSLTVNGNSMICEFPLDVIAPDIESATIGNAICYTPGRAKQEGILLNPTV